jgi:hypothetical protein
MNNKQKVILPIAIAILLVAVYFSYLSWNTWNNRHKSREFSLQLVDYDLNSEQFPTTQNS